MSVRNTLERIRVGYDNWRVSRALGAALLPVHEVVPAQEPVGDDGHVRMLESEEVSPAPLDLSFLGDPAFLPGPGTATVIALPQEPRFPVDLVTR